MATAQAVIWSLSVLHISVSALADGQDYRIGSLAKRTYINENRHENGISNYIWQNDSAEILIFSRIVF